MLDKYFCMDLYTAGIVIAAFGIFAGMTALFAFSIFLITIGASIDATAVDWPLAMVIAVPYLVIFLSIAFSAAIIYAVKNEQCGFLLPWLVLIGLNTFLSAIELCTTIFVAKPEESLGSVIGTAFSAYTWMAIYSLYCEMRSEIEFEISEA